MARQINRLSARKVQTLRDPGRHADGGGLYLVVDRASDSEHLPAKRWVFIFRDPSKPPNAQGVRPQTEMGIGPLSSISLARARELAEAARAALKEGKSPLATRNALSAAAANIPTFGELAETVIESLESGWRNEKHRAQWRSTMATYCAPIASKPVNEVSTEDVLGVLQPIWKSKNETASRVRGRIEKILDAAKAKGVRSGENPARWRGHLDHLLPKRQKLQRGHHPALPWQELPEFMTKLRQREAIASLALEFTILTAARTSEALGAKWSEIDKEAAVWIVPAPRMKPGREHRVPLSGRVVAILRDLEKLDAGEYLFPGHRTGRPLSGMAMEMLLRRMSAGNVTVHGFRSTFRDWCGEATNFPRELAEAALAHAVGDAVERAYRRGDALEKRRALMEAWANYCEPRQGNVVALSRKGT
jgi:integrase